MPSDPNCDAAIRVGIYRFFVDRGRAPFTQEIAEALDRDLAEVERAYDSLPEARVITLEPGSRAILMAHPFSAVPTSYRVRSGGISYWANCAWDAFGIAAMLGRDTEAVARCADCDEEVDLSVRDGRVDGAAGVIHFLIPPLRFWDNIAFT